MLWGAGRRPEAGRRWGGCMGGNKKTQDEGGPGHKTLGSTRSFPGDLQVFTSSSGCGAETGPSRAASHRCYQLRLT